MSAYHGYMDVVLELLKGLDTPLANEAIRLIAEEEWDRLCDLHADPALYHTAQSYLLDAQACALLKKCKNLSKKGSARAKQRAKDVWIAAERQCYQTNQRFRDYNSGYYPDVAPRLIQYLDQVKRTIAKVLGRVPSDLVYAGHGKGATYLDVGRSCTVLHKMQSQPTITADALCLLPLFWGSAWGRAVTRRDQSAPLVVPGNRWTTVPKNYKTDRSIAVEPSINIYFQLGVGRQIRQRLKDRAGIDLDEGQALHRALARRGSVDGTLSTLDLSSASDTVAYEVVRYLLPDDWFSLLESLRAKRTKVANKPYFLEKFSSMGNGFTFELETLIFWAICSCLSSKRVYTYGDDIIIATEHAPDAIAALKFFGFSLNEKKSFTSGRFRESCGGDFFDGHDVRPIYLKEPPNEPQQWISFANALRLLGHRLSGDFDSLDPRVRRAHARCLEKLPGHIRRIRGPASLGDLVIHDRRSMWQLHRVNWCTTIMTYSPVTKSIPLERFDPEVQLAAALYGVPSSGAVPRDAVSGYRRKWVPLLE